MMYPRRQHRHIWPGWVENMAEMQKRVYQVDGSCTVGHNCYMFKSQVVKKSRNNFQPGPDSMFDFHVWRAAHTRSVDAENADS